MCSAPQPEEGATACLRCPWDGPQLHLLLPPYRAACLPALSPPQGTMLSFPVHFITTESQSNPESRLPDWCSRLDRLFWVSWDKAPAAKQMKESVWLQRVKKNLARSRWSSEAAGKGLIERQNGGAKDTDTSIQEEQQDLPALEAEMHK